MMGEPVTQYLYLVLGVALADNGRLELLAPSLGGL